MALPFELSAASYRRLTGVALFCIVAIIVTGAAVRLSGSGLGCPTWPRCTGAQLIDVSDPHRAVEQLNRLFTGAVVLGCGAAFAGAFARRPYRRDLARLGALLVAGVFAQALIGGMVVLLDLQWQSVSLHFLASIALVYGGLELWRRAGEDGSARRLAVHRRVRAAAEVVFGVAIVLLFAGTLVTAAGPHGGDADVERLGWPVADAARTHGLVAWLLVVCTLGLLELARRHGAAETFRRASVLLAVLAAQGALGYVQYLNAVPPVLVGVHVFGAVCVFAAASWMRFASFDTEAREIGSSTAPMEVPAPAR
jgi:cytochrome c oxidase assembly protein subunit 15